MAELEARSCLLNQPMTSGSVDTSDDHDLTIAATYSKNKDSTRKCYFCGFERHQPSTPICLQSSPQSA
ncbi:hypothetical protein GE061_000953 [Apolygus lucorum]|uniref:Uncharacterized protein n=1 Tax=Apolygus lucorum TaxID=248454 RepID=A0A8S9Y7A5_APOLU|nr:hypothetical protein GE061_000953 [Apolygus lucorum]